MGGVCVQVDITVGVVGCRVTSFTSQNGGYCETSRLGRRAENHVGVCAAHPQNIRVSLFTALLRQQALCCHGYHEI